MKKGKIRTGPKTGVEVRFYRKDEWCNLSRDEQREVRKKRQQELKDNKRKAEDNDDDSAPSKIAALETLIKEQSQQIAALRSCSESKMELPPKPKGNPLKPPTGVYPKRMTRVRFREESFRSILSVSATSTEHRQNIKLII